MDLSQWISQAEAARIRGVSRQAISKLVCKGKLKSLDAGGHLLVNREEVVRYEGDVGGRPKATPKK